MKPAASIAFRALLAVVLMIGFYLLAVAIASGLLYIPYAEAVYAHRIHPKLALVCAFGGLAILWSVLPRFDKFEAPGPLLTAGKHPRLFQELDRVATAVKQAMPAEVFLVSDVNAWVAQRGGIMGFGSRRVMGLGLPLMRLLTRSELRAVLCHEFGHYYGGDTRLGPWIYKTRGAIVRTVSALSGGEGKGSLLQLPFLWYGKLFLRITLAVSRRQEFVADELAARAMGSRALIGGLRTVHRVAPAFQAYWANECAPVLNAGYRPPLAEGFQQFLGVGRIADIANKSLDEELESGETNPYDSHPPLRERIAAVEKLPAGEVEASDPAAITLLEDVPTLEAELLASLAGPEEAAKLKPVDWSEVGARVYVPLWSSLVKTKADALAGITPESLPALAADKPALDKRFQNDAGESIAEAVLGAALAVLLVNRGGKVHADPGESISVTAAGLKIEPFAVVGSLTEGKLPAQDWEQQCAAMGIRGLDLGSVCSDQS
jgi:heat shock protein HtpX